MNWLKETLRAKLALDSRLCAQVEDHRIAEGEKQAKIWEQWEKVTSPANLALGKWKELEADRILEDLRRHHFGGQLSFLAVVFQGKQKDLLFADGTVRAGGEEAEIYLGETDKGWIVKHKDMRHCYMNYTATEQTMMEALSRSQFQPDEVEFCHIIRGLYKEYEYEDRSGHPDNWGTRTGTYTLFRLCITPNSIFCNGKLLASIGEVNGVRDFEDRIDRFIAEGLDKELKPRK